MNDPILQAVHLAAPIFRQQEWLYDVSNQTKLPGEIELYTTIERLVRIMLADPEIEFARSGRFTVKRDDDNHCLTIMLELAEV